MLNQNLDLFNVFWHEIHDVNFEFHILKSKTKILARQATGKSGIKRFFDSNDCYTSIRFYKYDNDIINVF